MRLHVRQGSRLAPCAPVALLFVGLFVAPAARAQEESRPALVLLLDASGSMNGDDGTGRPKIVAAQDALASLVRELPQGVRVGLRVYGHRVSNAPSDKKKGCRDTELIAPVAPLRQGRMIDRVRSFRASGWTPIGLSLSKAARDLPAGGDRTIVLVSDGIDTCAPPPPCRVAREISKRGIGLRIDTIGFQVDPKARRQLRCIARVAGGDYADAPSSSELARRLSTLSLRALRVYKPTGEPVDGSPDVFTAPVVGAGQYVDEIPAGQTLHYGVELALGQSLRVSSTLLPPPGAGAETSAFYRIRIMGPDGTYIGPTEDVVEQPIPEPVSVSTETGVVGADAETPEPGVYHFAVEFRDLAGAFGEPAVVEHAVEVLGEPVAPSPTAPPEAAPPSDRPAEGPGWPGLAGVGLAGIVLGGLLGDRLAAWARSR
jgi:Ca-activated chloride channel family protein